MIVITQPTYLPWAGYFSLIDQSKIFVFLDDVQFDRRSWQQRNIILNNKKKNYLTVPVKKKGKRFQTIKEVEVIEKNFFEKHLKIIHHSYSSTKFFNEIFPKFEKIKSKINNTNSLSEINIILIKEICEIIKIETNFLNSSNISVPGSKSSKLVNICNELDSKTYLTNSGAKQYIVDDIDLFKTNEINVFIQNYQNKKYNQSSDLFIEKLSVIDLIFNEGPRSLDIIRSGCVNEKI